MAKSKTIDPALEHLAVSMGEISLWPQNARMGDVGAISESLKRFGQVRPILVQKSTMQIVAGNHLYRAAAALGWTEIAAVVSDISDKDARAYVVADNRMADLGTYDDELLAQMLADLARDDNLVGTGYDGDDIDDLIQGAGQGGNMDDTEKPLPDEPWVKQGQIFQLGLHRVVCADVRVAGVIEALLDGKTPAMAIVTPPYEDDPSNKNPISLTSVADISSALFDLGVQEQYWFGADRYHSALFKTKTENGNTSLDNAGSWLVWDKRADAEADAQFGDAFELIFSATPHKRDILRHQYAGVTDKEGRKRGDLTLRPTAVFTEIMERWSKYNDIILDPFMMTSGPTLAAAERCGRVVYGANSDPAKVQSLIERWQDYSKDKAELIGEV